MTRIFKQYSLGYIIENGKLLLGWKKKGYGTVRYNGVGGKVNPGESFEQSLKREFQEEVAITPHEFEKLGILIYDDFRKQTVSEVHIYLITKYSGQPVTTDEMTPEWFDIKTLPYEKMWGSDKHWMPYFLRGQKFIGQMIETQDRKLDYKVKKVDNLDNEICVLEKRYLICK